MKDIVLSNRIRAYRRQYHWSQQQLADAVGVSRNTIASIERGVCTPSAQLAYCLCQVLAVPFETLFYVKKEEAPQMIHRIGYACLNKNTRLQYKTCRKESASKEKITELVAHNLTVLKEMALWNEKNGVQLYRISSGLIPFGSLILTEYQILDTFAEQFAEIAEIFKRSKQRFSMHPGQYTVLNSPNAEVVANSIDDLIYHAHILEQLQGTQENKMVLHIGGVYGDKHAAMERFIQVANQLPELVRRHLILENDDKLFSIDEVLEIAKQTHLPVVFDYFHHVVHPPQHSQTLDDYLHEVEKTWHPEDGRMILHYSQQADGKKAGSHSETITAEEFVSFQQKITLPCDIMLEVKDKNRSAIKVMQLLAPDKRVIETEWARHKYFVLSKSQKLHHAIRDSLKKAEWSAIEFYTKLEEAQTLPENPREAYNAYLHVWGYFKDFASAKEKEQFFAMLDQYKSGEISELVVKRRIKRLLSKYPNPYLQNNSYLLD